MAANWNLHEFRERVNQTSFREIIWFSSQSGKQRGLKKLIANKSTFSMLRR